MAHLLNIIVFALRTTLLILVSFAICVDFHEFGHFIVGKLLGMKLVRIDFSFVTLYHDSGRWRIQLKQKQTFFFWKVVLDFDKFEQLERTPRWKLVVSIFGEIVFSGVLSYLLCVVFGRYSLPWLQVASLIMYC